MSVTNQKCSECCGTGLCTTCEGEGVLYHFKRTRCEDCAGSGECARCFEQRVSRDSRASEEESP